MEKGTRAMNYAVNPAPWNPHAYQKKGVKWLLEQAAAALFLDPGMGKTSITLAAIKFLKKRGMLGKVLVIAPLRPCYEVWPKEVEKWTDFTGLTVELLHGKDKDAALLRKADIYIINPDGLDWLLGASKSKTATGRTAVAVDIQRFKKMGFDTLVVDELTQFKHTGTHRFKALRQVLHLFQRRWGLTGSPRARSLLDLFGQCYVLDMGNALGRYVTQYRNEFFDSDHMGYVFTPKEGAEKRIYSRIAPLALRMGADDHLDLPKEVYNTIYVELPKPVRRTYDDMEREFFTVVGDKALVAVNAAVASGKCRQIAGGRVYTNAGGVMLAGMISERSVLPLHTAKLEALKELVDGLQGEPILIAYEFQHDLEGFREVWGKGIPVIGGGTAPKRVDELVAAWNREELPILFGHPKSMGHGLNLQGGGKHICWYNLTWDYELYSQFNYRIRRQGSRHSHSFYHHILAKDTLDEAVYRAMQAKAKGQEEFFAYLKAYQKGRGRDCTRRNIIGGEGK